MTATPQDPELTRPWRKSRHSDTGGQCVEVAQAGTTCAVRDSTNPGGSRLAFSKQAWAAFTSSIKHSPYRASASERDLPA